mgnify:CR=1 FL=1
MSLADLAQPGSLSNPTAFAEYLTFVVRDADVTPERVADALAMLSNATKSIAQKDSNGRQQHDRYLGARLASAVPGRRHARGTGRLPGDDGRTAALPGYPG